jgi:hypothetical protein
MPFLDPADRNGWAALYVRRTIVPPCANRGRLANAGSRPNGVPGNCLLADASVASQPQKMQLKAYGVGLPSFGKAEDRPTARYTRKPSQSRNRHLLPNGETSYIVFMKDGPGIGENSSRPATMATARWSPRLSTTRLAKRNRSSASEEKNLARFPGRPIAAAHANSVPDERRRMPSAELQAAVRPEASVGAPGAWVNSCLRSEIRDLDTSWAATS